MAVTLGAIYYYHVEAANQLGNSTPSNEVGPISASAFTTLNMETDSSSSSIGILITIAGQLKTIMYGEAIGGMNIDLSYSVNNGQTWIDIPSVTTSANGNFSTQWIPTATGVYMLKGSWAGNAAYQPSNSTMNLAVASTSGSDNDIFTVQSNSTISGLSFNSTSMQLSFTVSGQTGTYGYTRIVVSKQLVTDGAAIKLTMDGADLNYSISSTNSSWILYFTYHHSSHQVVADLAIHEPVNAAAGNDTPILIVGGLATVAIVFIAVLFVLYQRRKEKQR